MIPPPRPAWPALSRLPTSSPPSACRSRSADQDRGLFDLSSFDFHFSAREVLVSNRIVVERQRIRSFEPLSDVRHYGGVVGWSGGQSWSEWHGADFALFDYQFPALEDVTRQFEHRFEVGAWGVNGHVR